MSFRPTNFVKGGGNYEVTTGGYLITDAKVVIPNPTSQDPEKQKKIDSMPTITALRLELIPLDDDDEPTGIQDMKILDLKMGFPNNPKGPSVRPGQSPSTDEEDGEIERGAEGYYMVPSDFQLHDSSKAAVFIGSFWNALIAKRGLEDEDDINALYDELDPQDGDVRFLVGYKVVITVERKKINDKAKLGVDEYNSYVVSSVIEERQEKKKAGKTGKAAAKTEVAAASKPAKSKPAPVIEDNDEDDDIPSEDTGAVEGGVDEAFDATAAVSEMVKELAAKNKTQNATVLLTMTKMAIKKSDFDDDTKQEMLGVLSEKFVQKSLKG